MNFCGSRNDNVLLYVGRINLVFVNFATHTDVYIISIRFT
jgi:hypothetical protein